MLATLTTHADTSMMTEYQYDAATRLAGDEVIVQHNNMADYRLHDNVLRQEVVGVAVKMDSDIALDTDYSCKGYYTDLSQYKPNGWACRAVELAADADIVTRANAQFRPEDYITRAEALAMVYMVGGENLTAKTYTQFRFSSDTVAWQKQLLGDAYAHGVVDTTLNFGPNELATRGEIFVWADRLRNPDERLSVDMQSTSDVNLAIYGQDDDETSDSDGDGIPDYLDLHNSVSFDLEVADETLSMSSIVVEEGDEVTIHLSTQSDAQYKFVIDEFAVMSGEFTTDSDTMVTFLADDDGVYEYYITMDDEKQVGMSGVLFVE